MISQQFFFFSNFDLDSGSGFGFNFGMVFALIFFFFCWFGFRFVFVFSLLLVLRLLLAFHFFWYLVSDLDRLWYIILVLAFAFDVKNVIMSFWAQIERNNRVRIEKCSDSPWGDTARSPDCCNCVLRPRVGQNPTGWVTRHVWAEGERKRVIALVGRSVSWVINWAVNWARCSYAPSNAEGSILGKLKAAAWNILFSAGDMMNWGAAWWEASPSPISSSLPELQSNEDTKG